MIIDSKEEFGLYMVTLNRDASPTGCDDTCQPGGPLDGDPPPCTPHFPIPVVALLQTDGNALVNLMQTQSVSFEIKTAKIKPKDFEVLKKVYNTMLFISQAPR